MNKFTYLYQAMLLLLCAVVFNSTVFGQTKKAPPAPRVYKLQIAAYREINFAKNVKGLDTIGTLYIEDDPSGIYRVVMGTGLLATRKVRSKPSLGESRRRRADSGDHAGRDATVEFSVMTTSWNG